jgi:hypothetical protein
MAYAQAKELLYIVGIFWGEIKLFLGFEARCRLGPYIWAENRIPSLGNHFTERQSYVMMEERARSMAAAGIKDPERKPVTAVSEATETW